MENVIKQDLTIFLLKCLVTLDATPPGGVIRVRFDDPGRYEYEVMYVEKDRKEKGVIAVLTPPGY